MQQYKMNREIAEERRQRLMHEANQYRLRSVSQVYRPGLVARLLTNVGGWMVAEGTRLQSRYNEANKNFNRQDVPATEIIFS